MVRQSNPRKDRQKKQNESNEIPLRIKKGKQKEKYRHQNNWLEEDEDFDLEENLYAEDDDDYIFDDELDIDFDENFSDEKEENNEEEENDDDYY